MKKPPDPSYSAEHADECCMSCGARLEEGEPGKCNRCGGDYNVGRKQASVQIRNLAKQAAAVDTEIEKQALWGAAAKLGVKGLGMAGKALGFGAKAATKAVPAVAKGIGSVASATATKAVPAVAKGIGSVASGAASSPNLTVGGLGAAGAAGTYYANQPSTPTATMDELQRNPAIRRSPSPSVPVEQQKSLADVLPAGYRQDAQAHAKAYRDKQGPDFFEPEVNWRQSLDDKAIDRKVRIQPFKPAPNGALTPVAQYLRPQRGNDGNDRIELSSNGSANLGHELTHATQSYLPTSVTKGRRPTQAHSVLIDGISASRGMPAETGDYLAGPQEEEAYLADVKRDYYRATGKHVTNSDEAREAIEWMQAKPPGTATPLLESFLRDDSRDTPDNLKQRELWIQELTKRMPGLVSNNQSSYGKMASVQEGNVSVIIKLARQAAAESKKKEPRDGDGDGKVNEGKPNETKAEKKPNTGKALGTVQGAYVADAAGAASEGRAAKKITEKFSDKENQGIYDDFQVSTAPYNAMLQKRIQRGASRQAESGWMRHLSNLDPTRSESGEGLIGMSTGLGSKDMSAAQAVTAERYKKKIQPHQDKIDDPDGEVTSRETPWHMRQQGRLANQDSDVAGHKYHRNETPLSYWLNPLDRTGPLNEITDRLLRRHTAGSASPDSTLGRFAASSVPLASLFMGGEDAQQKLRRSTYNNDIYTPEAKPDVKEASVMNFQIRNLAKAAVAQANDNVKKAGVNSLANMGPMDQLRDLLQQQSQGGQSARGALGGALGGLAGLGTGGLAGAGGAAGATIGGLKGLFSDPGEDEEGNQKSRLMAALKGGLGGGALGAAGGLAAGAGGLAGAFGGGAAGNAAGSAIGRSMGGSAPPPPPSPHAGLKIATAQNIPRMARASARRRVA